MYVPSLPVPDTGEDLRLRKKPADKVLDVLRMCTIATHVIHEGPTVRAKRDPHQLHTCLVMILPIFGGNYPTPTTTTEYCRTQKSQILSCMARKASCVIHITTTTNEPDTM